MTDTEFLRAFENCEIATTDFRHRDHLRLTWTYLQHYGPEAAPRMAASIRRFAAHHGKNDKYHETVTIAWMCLVADCAKSGVPSFQALIDTHPELLDKTALREFYSDSLLQSGQARTRFVPPDLKPLPNLGIIPSGVLK